MPMPDFTKLDPDQLRQVNQYARNAIARQGVEMKTQVLSTGLVPATQNVLNVPVLGVGLVDGFLIKVEGTLRNTDAALVAALTPFGASNLLSNITLTDFANNQRISAPGWLMHVVNSAKQPMVMGEAIVPNISVGWGNNWQVMSAPATIAAVTDAAVQFYYWVPCSYTKDDKRGAMYAGLTGANAQLSLTINPTPGVNAGDPTQAVYKSSNAVIWKAGTNVQLTVWQCYTDNLPRWDDGNVMLPPIDMSQLYQIQNIVSPSVLVLGQDCAVPYANYRQYMSTTVVFDNGGSLNVGSDVNYFALQAANTQQLFKYGPEEAAFFARQQFMADPPAGCYYFDHRRSPINTLNFGNMQLVVNPAVVNANASLLVGFEWFSTISQIQYATSLP